MSELPTIKQINFANDIASVLDLALPEEKTKKAYSSFISENIDRFNTAKRSYVDEDLAEIYGSCLEDIL